MLKVTAGIVTIVAFLLLVEPAASQSQEKVLPVSSELFLAGYAYGKLSRYYGRSLANFKTLTSAQKDYEKEVMIALSVHLEMHARSLGCPPRVLQAIGALESELSARGKPSESRLSEMDSFHECVDQYGSDLRGYWWTGRSVGGLSWLFENLERPQVELRPNSSDRALIGELKYLGLNSIQLYGTKDLPPRVEQLLKALESIRMENSQKTELDTATRNLVKQYVNEILPFFLLR
ncbi:MAG TPA: hypothetical protein VKS43_14895 [Burkholderiales bacterium]|nr:hypothetical protein [Burkholderiales bacterium]